MSRHALPRPVRGPFPGPDGAYIILSSSRSCDVLIELYGSGLVVWTLQFPRTIKDETPLRSHNLCMLRRWRRWRRDWRSSNRRLSIASDLLSLFCPLLGTHTSLYLLPPKTKKKSQKKSCWNIAFWLRPVDGSASARGSCGCCCWPSGKAASGSQFNWSAKGGQGEKGHVARGQGEEGVWNRKGTRPQNKFQVEIFFAAGVFITLHGFELCC